MNFNQADYHILQTVYFLIARYDYQIVNVSKDNHNIYLINQKRRDYPLVKVTKLLVSDYHDDLDYQHHIQDLIQQVTHTHGKLLVLSVNPESTPSTFDDFDVVVLKVNQKINHENEMIQSMSDLLVESQNLERDIRFLDLSIMRATRKQTAKERRKWKNIPKLTFTIGAICVAYFLAILFLTMATNQAIDSAIFLGAYYKMSVVAMKEYWRLLTAGFMHIDFFHLLINMVALWSLGNIMEKLFSKRDYLIILIGSIIVGNLFVLIGDPNTVTVGISGGLYGFLGAFVVSIFMNGGFRNPRIRSSIIQVILINLLLSFMPGVSLMGHLGGLFFGLLAGIVLSKNPFYHSLKVNTAIAGSLALLTLVIMGARVNRVEPIYDGNDANLIKIAEMFHLDSYAKAMEENFKKYYR